MREILLLALLIFLPIAHGGVEVWSVTVMHVATIAVSAIWIFSLIRNGYIRIYRTPLDILLLLLILYLLISLSFSIYPYASRIQLYRIINYIAVFYILTNLLRDKGKLISFSSYLAFLGAIYGFASLVFISGNFLGLKVFSSGDFLSFTFRNHNHFAGYMNMITWLCIGMSLYNNGRKRLLFIALSTISASTVLLSLSRGGILGLSGGAIFFSSAGMLSKNKKAIFMATALIAIAVVALMLTGSFDRVFERMWTLTEPELTTGERLRMWGGVFKMIKDNPLFGTGIGTFAYAYSPYQTIGGYTIDHAHNEYLEIISETGVVGGILIGLCILVVFRYVLKHSIPERGRNLSCIGLTALTACFSLLIHELSDFNLYIPSNALLFTVCGAIAFTSASIISNGDSGRLIEIRLTNKGRFLSFVISVIILFISLILISSPYISSIYQKKAMVYQLSEDYTIAYRTLKRAILFDPGNAELLSSTGDLLILHALTYGDNKEREFLLNESIKYYDEAINMAPLRVYFYRRKAYALKNLNRFNDAEALLKRAIELDRSDNELYYELAELYLETGKINEAMEKFKEYVIRVQGGSLRILDVIWDYTEDYNKLKKAVPEDAGMRTAFANFLWRKGMHEDALKEFAYAYELAPSVERAFRHLQYLINAKRYREGYHFCKKYLKDFKDNIQLYKKLLWFSKRLGKLDEAILICEKLADLDSRNRLSYKLEIARIYCRQKNWKGAFGILEKIRYNAPDTPELYFVMAGCYRGRKMFVQALKAREKAVSLMPDNPDYLFNLGFDYRVNGLHEKALESWRRCLEVNPSHKGCREWARRYEVEGW